ncbi:hypothetical protein SGQ44_12045 [Flavobacterium sp. Fl-77]|uniref:Metallo-beta-lactamase domain-containing protein n=1 Tax=Flavobacterium flavipigmentatum TaxID=2893884 RepID=A0AAJ2SAC0_9FLAO|nr:MULTISPECIES: hypothetical protein [unclassified Flavobacterium]MDX6183044.1 hypothetical protein [Flavobacterium sp. Fl-33]MDX6186497.1 hypothetical protein [Flavobacterium sp. Fl-77]UFH37720.1 hypothetical protein LNP22_13360 [Flavobacterium sp. F-70]
MSKLSVSIRMYRVGELGDCFYLKFAEGEKSCSVLIDCGSFRNGGKSVQRMREIAQHIADEQKEDALDVVVGTHQHNDHLSGFKHAKDIFLKLKAKQAWLSWLDDPEDKSAQKISRGEKELTAKLRGIKTAISDSKNAAFSNHIATERLNDILGFYLDGDAPAVPAEGLKILKEMSSEVKYLQPGNQFSLPGMDEEVKVYVLGPPRNTKLLFDITAAKDESYDHKLKAADDNAQSFLKALSNFSNTGAADPDEDYFPFNNRLQKPICDDQFVKSTYNDVKNEWQRIDTDWLDQAGRLALYLDSYTNNTSLVLAFELVKSGKVLLFVGDAQTGNWLSWNDILWQDKPSGFNVDNLLEKTVFYKVGHHCSHNATLVAGLEKMNSEELVAMIPVDKNDPNITKKNGWKMPASNLHNRLKEKTKFRIIRMEDTYDKDCDPSLSNVAKESWSKLSGAVDSRSLYVEYTIKT